MLQGFYFIHFVQALTAVDIKQESSNYCGANLLFSNTIIEHNTNGPRINGQ